MMTTRPLIHGWLLAAALLLALPAAFAESGVGSSTPIPVDTRNLTLTGLTISGPTTVPWDQERPYTATLALAGGGTQDVTAEALWDVTGGPPVTSLFGGAAMWWNILDPHEASPIPLKITARITRNGGQIVSTPYSVVATEGTGINVWVRLIDPTGLGPIFVRTEGSSLIWRVVAEPGGLAADKPGVTFQWTLDGQPRGSGRTLDLEFASGLGTRQLGLTATDPQGRTGQDYRALVFDAPPELNEPPQLVRTIDPPDAQFLNKDGGSFQFDPTKTYNGLVVVTHGLRSSGEAPWLGAMAQEIHDRFPAATRPNIVIYDWGAMADPTRFAGYEELRDAMRERAFGNLPVTLPNELRLSEASVNFLVDALLVRPSGQAMGDTLGDWLRSESVNGNILSSRPIHLIGHSAGGFVVGEAGWQLRWIASALRVTMLDTPFPYTDHLASFPAADTKLDRYISSAFGTLEFPWTRARNLGTALFSPHVHYRTLESFIPLAGHLVPTHDAHSYSHEWYLGTISSATEGVSGFGLSPLFSSGGGSSIAGFAQNSPPPPPTETVVPITGFATFGAVTPDAQGYVVAEGAARNAGLVLAGYSFPAGTHTLRFRYQFTTPGDGDFLTVSFGNGAAIYIGKDMPLTRDAELTADVSVDHLSGEAGDLVFRLVSRGAQNAVLTVHDIVSVVAEDPDSDTLSNATETTLGTNPMRADTDGDGVNDADEVNLHLTNPLLADSDADGLSDGEELAAGTDPKNAVSRFAIRAISRAGGAVTLDWWSQPSRAYRVLRSDDVSFDSYQVIGAALPGAAPARTFLDSSAPTGRGFYKIQLEPVP